MTVEILVYEFDKIHQEYEDEKYQLKGSLRMYRKDIQELREDIRESWRELKNEKLQAHMESEEQKQQRGSAEGGETG